MNQFPPKPLIIPIEPFRIFSEIRGNIHSSRCTTGVNDTGSKWKKIFKQKIFIISFGHLWVVDTGGKFAAGINHTGEPGGKIAAGAVDTGGKFAAGVVDSGGNFADGVTDTGGAP
jgi:hypothetical protein